MQQRRQMSKRMRTIILLACVVVGIGAGLYVWLDQFYVENSADLSVSAPPSEATPFPPENEVAAASLPLQPDGSPYPAIFIPSAGISEYIIESRLEASGWRVDHLGNRVGHLEGTTPIGNSGNIVLAGHIENSEGLPSVFSQLGQLEVGAAVTLSQGAVVHQYAVSEVRVVASDDLSVVYDLGDDRLTLITCTGYNFLTDVYDERIVVVAHRVQ
jgi:LPXTG-site transpeptidase (sortase) family protein